MVFHSFVVYALRGEGREQAQAASDDDRGDAGAGFIVVVKYFLRPEKIRRRLFLYRRALDRADFC
jgi:hypothetical protein